MWIKRSETHREKFQKLLKYVQKHPEKITLINGVSVCFEPEFCIDTGSSSVYIGLAKDGYERAVKCVQKNRINDLPTNEKEILNTPNAANSERVVNYRYCDVESNKFTAFLVLDLHEETLVDYVERESQERLTANAPVIIEQILKGLDDLHNPKPASTSSHAPGYKADPNPKPKSILHRDLKPSNILRNVYGGRLWYKSNATRRTNLSQKPGKRDRELESCRVLRGKVQEAVGHTSSRNGVFLYLNKR